MRRFSLTVVLMAATTLAVAGDFEASRRAWLEGPASFLLGEADRSELALLSSADQLAAFERLFWARRDPDLATPGSEAKVDFDDRVAAADDKLGTAVTRGAMTDRGRVLILLGGPTRNAVVPIASYLAELYGTPPAEHGAAAVAPVTDHGVTFVPAKGHAHVWAYRVDQLPVALRPAGADPAAEVVFAFFDLDGSGEFHLHHGIRLAAEAEAVLAAAPSALVVHPELSAAPLPPLWPEVVPASLAQIALLDGGALPWPEGAEATVTRGVRGPGDLPLWVALVVPAGLPPADVAVGRARAADGSGLGSFQLPAVRIEAARGRAYELALPVPAATASLELALLADGQPVAGRTLEVSADDAAAGAVFVSRVVAGAEIAEARAAAAGTPFVFGGYHLLPRPDGRYRSDENLSLFVVVAAAGEQPPAAAVRLRWVADGISAPSSPAQPVQLGKAGDGVWVWGTQLPLAALSPGVEYLLKVKVEVGPDGLERNTELPVLVTGGEG